MWRSLGLYALALLTAACGTAAGPSATVGDLTAVEQALALNGLTIANAVSGDAGCDNRALIGNAVRFDVSLGGQPQRAIYLFRWRRPAQYDEAALEFFECAEEYAARAHEVTTLEVRPWRAYGAGWSDELTAAIDDALRAAGGT